MDKVMIILGLLFLSCVTFAEDNEEKTEMVAEGGRLYDKWWEEYNLKKPVTTHPAYPATGKLKGANTWRCKECHGWDYRGKDGAYGKGKHFTGIKGITGFAGKDPEQVMGILKNRTHRFDEVMLDYGLLRLAYFVSQGQVDISDKARVGDKKVSADIKRGKSIFLEHCKSCHGRDGRKRNFADKNKPEYVGTVASHNPWEAMHKLRNGHPDAYVMGDPMPSMISKIDIADQLNLLSYLQTLPVK